MPGEQACGAMRMVLEILELESRASASKEVQSEQRRRSRLLGEVQERAIRGGRTMDLWRSIVTGWNPSRSATCHCQLATHRYETSKVPKDLRTCFFFRSDRFR